jgi:hypothetical protein
MSKYVIPDLNQPRKRNIKMNMESSCVQLNDLPDEIILILFKKLNNVLLLYSLLSVNKRLNKVLYDNIFTNTMTLFEYFSFDYIENL